MRNTGDLKADLNGASLPADRVETFRKWLCEGHQDPILFAGSTGSLEEEELVLRAFAKVREKHPVRLLIGIRRLSRAAEVAQLIRSHGFTVTRRTEDGPPADVFLLDTLGKLSYAYRFGVAAYVGGSLGRGKGHNILEPLETGIPVAYGSNRGLFKESQIKAEEAGVGTRIETSDDLAAFFLRYLESPEEREKARVAGTELIRRNQGAVAASADELLKLIESCR